MARWSSNSPPPMPSRFAPPASPPTPPPERTNPSAPTCTPRTEPDVFPRLPRRHYPPAAGLGRRVSARALSADVLLQFLVRLRVGNHCAFLEPRQLPRTSNQARLLADAATLHVDRRPRHVLFHAARLPARLLPLVSRRRKKRSLLPARHHPAVGQLPCACLCMEDDSRH